jgi:hypothetical protein
MKRPGADAGDVVAPRLRPRHRRRVGEPERAGVGDAEAILPEQNRRKLARPDRIVTADADDGVAGRGGDDLVDLRRQRFLQPEEIGTLGAHDVEQHLAPQRPVILAVVGSAIPDVERHHRQGIGPELLRGSETRTRNDEQNQTQHTNAGRRMAHHGETL